MKRASVILLLFVLSVRLTGQIQCTSDIIAYRKGTHWGFCDVRKKMIVPAVYQQVQILPGKILRGVYDGDTSDLYDRNGRLLTKVDELVLKDGYITITKNGLSGMLDTNGRIIIPMKYKGGVAFLGEGMIGCVSSYADAGCEVHDTSGRLMFGMMKGNVSAFYHGRAWVRDGEKLGVTDRKGTITWLDFNPKYYIEEFHENFVRFNSQDGKGGEGLMSFDGKMVVPANGNRAITFWPEHLIEVEHGEKHFGLVDTTGKIILPFDYSSIKYASQNENLVDGPHWEQRKQWEYFVVTKDDAQGLIDSLGNFIVPVEYRLIGPINEGLFWVIKDGKYGYFNIGGKMIVPAIYDKAGGFNDGLAWVMQGKQTRLINNKGEFINEEVYENAKASPYIWQDSIIIATQNGKYGVVNYSGKTIVPFEYNYLFIYPENLITVRKDSLFGMFDAQGHTLVPVRYSSLGYFSGGYAWAKRGGKYLILDSLGHETVPGDNFQKPSYPEPAFQGGWSTMQLNGKAVYVDTRGTVLPLSLQYDNVSFSSGRFIMYKDKKCGVADIHGVVAAQPKYDQVLQWTTPSVFMVLVNGKTGYVGMDGTEYFED